MGRVRGGKSGGGGQPSALGEAAQPAPPGSSPAGNIYTIYIVGPHLGLSADLLLLSAVNGGDHDLRRGSGCGCCVGLSGWDERAYGCGKRPHHPPPTNLVGVLEGIAQLVPRRRKALQTCTKSGEGAGLRAAAGSAAAWQGDCLWQGCPTGAWVRRTAAGGQDAPPADPQPVQPAAPNSKRLQHSQHCRSQHRCQVAAVVHTLQWPHPAEMAKQSGGDQRDCAVALLAQSHVVSCRFPA